MLAIIFVILAVVLFIVFLSIRPSEVIARWYHYFDEVQFSSQDVYKEIQAAIERRKIPSQFYRKDFFERGMLSSKREYLRVTNVIYIFDICAAPYGTGFFVSWWLRESKSVGELLLERLQGRGGKKTYYEIDTQSMFRESMHKAILGTLAEISISKGVRGLTELEQQVQTNPKYNFQIKVG